MAHKDMLSEKMLIGQYLKALKFTHFIHTFCKPLFGALGKWTGISSVTDLQKHFTLHACRDLFY